MNTNVSEELVNNDSQRNSIMVPYWHPEYEGAYVLPVPPSHIQPIVIGGIPNYLINLFISEFDISIIEEESKESEEFDCPICFELSKSESKITLNCGHTFCGQCIKKTLTSCNRRRTLTCALCRTNVSSFKVPNKQMHELLAPHCNNAEMAHMAYLINRIRIYR
jgi:hypothetical protein